MRARSAVDTIKIHKSILAKERDIFVRLIPRDTVAPFILELVGSRIPDWLRYDYGEYSVRSG